MPTLHSTLAIEGERLSRDQVTALLDGKRALGEPRQLLAAKNAIATYERGSRGSYAQG